MEFDRWRATDPAHAIAFARAWHALRQVDADQRGITDFSSVTVRKSLKSSALSRRHLLRGAVVGAAMATGALGLLTSRAYAWDRAETGVGEMRSIVLPDGTRMTLNTDSAAAWRIDDVGHRIRLERGEIALDVHSAATTFSVTSAGLTAQLSVGRFNIRRHGDVFDVLVLQGRAQPALVTSTELRSAVSEQALVMTDTSMHVYPASRSQIDALVAWPRGEILFHDEPLAVAVAEFNRYLEKKIAIVDPDLIPVRVGGRFTPSSPAAFLEALQTTLDINVRATHTQYLLTRKK